MDRLRIKEAVESGRYEETLKVAFDAPRDEIQKAHIRALAKHRNCTVTRELINHAKSRLTCETDLEKGRRLILIGMKELALKYLTRALEEDGDADDCILAGQTLEQLSRVEQALAYFEKAVTLRGYATDYLWLGMALERLVRYDEAVDAYTQAVDGRGRADDYLAKGRLLLRLKRFDEAKPCLEKAFDLGEKITSLQLLQQLKTYQGRARIKKVITAISGFLNGKNKGAD